MRFVDASVFLYAYLKPKKVASSEIAEMKKAARNIVKRIDSGEKVATSLIHLSEVANILEAAMPIFGSHRIMRDLIHSPTLSVIEPTRENYMDAVEVAEEASVGLNDGVAYVLMKESGIAEIYSFDKHFDRFKDIRRIQV
jgi:predicted nucleic acid-binding protein